MIIFLVVILIIALVAYWIYKHQGTVAHYLRNTRWGSWLLSWYHSVSFDLRMQNPDQFPKQILTIFVALVFIIGAIAILIAGRNQ